MSDASQEKDSPGYGLMCLTAAAVLTALGAIFIYVPTEKTEGVVQRIMYFHVPSAWIAFFAFFVVFLCSILYLWKKEREWDIYAHASAEIGIVFCSLVLITGPLWAKPIWGVWWVWDARLTSTLVLWLIYVAYLMLRAQSEAGSTRAKYAAVIGIVGFLDIPLIHFSVLWWRTFHPDPKFITTQGLGTGNDSSMNITLLIAVGAFTLLYFLLMSLRVRLERMKDEIDRIKKRDFTLTKKYAAIFTVLFVAAILIMVDHYYETPMTLADVQRPPGVDTEKSEVGFKAPDFTARNLKGHRVKLADHKGKVVVLNLWATWCGPCRVEMPGMENLYRRYRSQGLEILAVSLDKGSSDKVQTFADEYRLSFPVLLDSDGQVESRYHTLTIPTTFVIDKNGMIVAKVDGAKHWESEETFEAVEYLLKAPG